MPTTISPIGVFDSGVGGLSVLKAMREQMPEEAILYFGDQGHVPYGARSMEQIQNFSEGITKFLLKHNSKIIVVACNTASAKALRTIQQKDLAQFGPSKRVLASSPFSYTGLDYLGPLNVQNNDLISKCWISLFTCLAVREIHLELVQDCSAEEFLNCFGRLISCRGKPIEIISDNAAQFKLAKTVIELSVL